METGLVGIDQRKNVFCEYIKFATIKTIMSIISDEQSFLGEYMQL